MRISARQHASLLGLWGASLIVGAVVVPAIRSFRLLDALSEFVMLAGIATGTALLVVAARLSAGRGPPGQTRLLSTAGVVLGCSILLGAPLAFTPWRYESGLAAGMTAGATVMLWLIGGGVVAISVNAYKQNEPKGVLLTFAVLGGLGWWHVLRLVRLGTDYPPDSPLWALLWVLLVGGSLLIARKWPPARIPRG